MMIVQHAALTERVHLRKTSFRLRSLLVRCICRILVSDASEDGVGNVHRLILHKHDVEGIDVRVFSLFHLRDTEQSVRSFNTDGVDKSCMSFKPSDLVVEEADGEDVLVLRQPVRHGQVSQRVAQQQHVGPTLRLSEAGGTCEGAPPLVKGVNELAFKGSQDPLKNTRQL